MPWYIFDVRVHYHTDEIYAKSVEEAREIANEELQYCGEEWNTSMELLYSHYDDDDEDNKD